jgi:hypothetical protein
MCFADPRQYHRNADENLYRQEEAKVSYSHGGARAEEDVADCCHESWARDKWAADIEMVRYKRDKDYHDPT